MKLCITSFLKGRNVMVRKLIERVFMQKQPSAGFFKRDVMKNLAEFAGSRSQKSSLGVLKSSADSTKNPLLKRDFSISVFL